MSSQPSFPIPGIFGAEETTGRYVITFRDDATAEGLAALKKECGVSKVHSAANSPDSAVDLEKLDDGNVVFPTLGIAVVTMDESAASCLTVAQNDDSAILDIEPERIFYALGDSALSNDYLRGYRDAVESLYGKSSAGAEADAGPLETFFDDAQSTWGLKATRVVNSRYSGRGIKVAVLDTGLDLTHPDFRGRHIVSQSFISGEPVQDRNSHGTHCIGTACGNRDVNGRRYGIAYESSIYVGKVLSNAGSGPTTGILAGMEWAINARCEVISMSLGNTVPTSSTAYETAGRRALQAGTLIVAAAGNHRRPPFPGTGPIGTVAQPANSPSILAVGAVDNQLRLAPFSCTSGSTPGANVDIAGPGVNVYSSVPMPGRYNGGFSGTSMATPHVAGIAALWAQANRARGWQLWQLLTSRARRLSIPTADVGAGLVQAP
jgi:subtilisin family serine protease